MFSDLDLKIKFVIYTVIESKVVGLLKPGIHPQERHIAMHNNILP